VNLDRYAKCIVAALGVAYGLYVAATGADSAGGTSVVTNEWVGIAVTTILTAAGVWAVPNSGKPPVFYPSPDSVTTVNVDRAPAPGVSERLVQPSNGITDLRQP